MPLDISYIRLAQRVAARFLHATQEDEDSDDEYGGAGIGFEIVGKIREPTEIARGSKLRAKAWLDSTYGHGNWRKLKGTATVSYNNGQTDTVEVHWYEAHGIGKVDIKIKKW